MKPLPLTEIFIAMALFLSGCFAPKKIPAVAQVPPAGPNIISLFSDSKATPRVGDLITVQIVESASGSKKNTSRANRNTDLDADLKLDQTNNSSMAKLGMKTKNNYDADSRYVKQGSLVANLTAIVEEVYPNGTALIRGTQEISLDRGVQMITLSGIVRPEDISSSNSVLSTRLANAKITYKSKNEPNVNHQSLLGWLFAWIF